MLAACAIAAPVLIAVNLPPSATFFNHVLAVFGWGAWSLQLASRLRPGPSSRSPLIEFAFFALLVVTTLVPPIVHGVPWAQHLSAAGLVAGAGLVTRVSADVHRSGDCARAFCVLCLAMVLAGLSSSTVAVIQVLAPELADGTWIARTSVDGRAVGNLRQPNHLCSLLLWGVVAILWLSEARLIRPTIGLLLAALMLFAVVLSGSRSGLIGASLLALWGLVDRRVSRNLRSALLLVPVGYAVFWLTLSAWARHGNHVFGGAARFGSGDISSSRFGVWSNTLELIRSHPWFGVGFGEFNFAWTLTEFPNRPTAFFDHTHNLPLQFAVELGLPLAALVLGLLGWGLWRAWRNCLRPPEADGSPSPHRAAFVMLVLILVHSMLEYPLWYAYFLLPTAFLFGLCLATPGAAVPVQELASRRWGTHHLLRAGAILMMLGALYSVWDYMRVVVIFAPPANAAPLAERIAAGQRSTFFAHHADYAAATTSDDPAVALPAAQRAAHYLLDTRLMMAWANALHATGDTERAQYLAQRLVEFRNPMSEPYFAPCKDPSLTDAQRPYQCFAPRRKFTFEDFR